MSVSAFGVEHHSVINKGPAPARPTPGDRAGRGPRPGPLIEPMPPNTAANPTGGAASGAVPKVRAGAKAAGAFLKTPKGGALGAAAGVTGIAAFAAHERKKGAQDS